MASNRWLHDPDALLDYSVDWADWMPTGDAIASATWTVPTGLTLEAQTETDTRATVWLSGGSAGTTYTVICHIVTDDGREDDRSVTIKCQER